MSLDERLQTLELLWASIARTPEAVPTPEWHAEVLTRRLSKIERGEGGIRDPRPVEGAFAAAKTMKKVVAVLDLRRHPNWLRKQVIRRKP